MFYDNFKAACQKRNTTISGVLRELGRSTGSTGRWSSGSYPTLDIVMDIANHLGISLDELVYGDDAKPYEIDASQQEWLYIISMIPEERQQMCKDFLKTHMVVPEKQRKGKMA